MSGVRSASVDPLPSRNGGLAESPSLATEPAARLERNISTVVLVIAVATALCVAPFARTPLTPVPAFIPAYEAALCLGHTITAGLLFGQFARLKSPALLWVASGYLFVAIMVAAHLLAFPGIFSPTGLLGASSQSAAWIYCFWHAGFPLFVLCYAVQPESSDDPRRSTRWGSVLAAGLTIAVAVELVLVATAGGALLPVINHAGNHSRVMGIGVSPTILLLCVAALVALLLRRRKSVLDVWLMVVMGAWGCDVTLTAVFGASRFDLGWYSGRLFGLLSGGFVLGALLLEMNRLYSRLSRALVEAQARNDELIRSRAELARGQRLEAIGELTGGVAHDFNNLLAIILGDLDLILRKPDDPDRVTRLGGAAMKAAERGARLVKQLLTFARRQNLRPEVVNPNALILEMQTLVTPAAGGAIAVLLNLDRAAHPVRIDGGEFQAAILNLITNARDAMQGGGRVSIETRNVWLDRSYQALHPEVTLGAYLSVTVSDSGVGMEPETVDRVFEPFFTTKPIGSGTGLGLSQVYGFARSAGGHVTVTSELGVGTTVKIYLPCSREALSAMDEASPPMRTARPGETVLVVEDHADVIDTAAESLRDLGYRVLTASDAREALAVIGSNDRIDILFSDVIMPGGMNGVQLAAEATRVRPTLRVLLTSGFTGTALRSHDLTDRFPLLDKPYRQEELADKLRGISGGGSAPA